MVIRKLFKFEGAHVVRNCSSDRCKKSIHGHSYVVEVFLEADKLDNGMMVYDFGLFKGTIKDFLDSFDHAYSMWDKETSEFAGFINQYSDRVVTMPISPSAEGYALLIAYVVDKIIRNTLFMNGEDENLRVHKVIVAETVTGYAEANMFDVASMFANQFGLKDIIFSDEIKDEWSDPDMWNKLLKNEIFVNPTIEVTHK
jgi:6-pyruvoyltetrahydropterin/6-carboxytetrahydropterin synthase